MRPASQPHGSRGLAVVAVDWFNGDWEFPRGPREAADRAKCRDGIYQGFTVSNQILDESLRRLG